MNWFETAERAARPYYEAILALPFINELIEGSLPREKFIFYIRQDSLYLRNYSRVLSHIASRMPDAELTELFLRFAQDSVSVEREMHAGYIAASGGDAPEMSPLCELYTSVQRAQALEDVAVEAASILPCFKVYLDCGLHIHGRAKNLDSHPYGRWIATYADESFAEATARAIEACNRLAASASAETREAMTRMYVLCTRLEWMFWDSAYNLEKWKI
jgi:thiaminase/transcriptional activator TenA